jgi:hypothetical protein
MTRATDDKPKAACDRETEGAAASYVSDLKARFGKYARPAAEARRIVDEAMGASSLTELLYKSREDGAK